MKGGHLSGDYSVDVLYYDGKYHEFKAPRLEKKTTHGTGCSFSATIAAGLAKGRSIPEAVSVAKTIHYTSHRLWIRNRSRTWTSQPYFIDGYTSRKIPCSRGFGESN